MNIINVTDLDHFEDRCFVVAQIAYEINKWMRTLAGTSEPRLLFFIDEIGGGGGKQALFPSFPYESAAGWGLNYLVRQGRAVGVCCLFATQNPGDVDYKGLSNCHTWIIGKLATDRDRPPRSCCVESASYPQHKLSCSGEIRQFGSDYAPEYAPSQATVCAAVRPLHRCVARVAKTHSAD